MEVDGRGGGGAALKMGRKIRKKKGVVGGRVRNWAGKPGGGEKPPRS